MERIPLAILRVHGVTSVELPPTRTLSDEYNGMGSEGKGTNGII